MQSEFQPEPNTATLHFLLDPTSNHGFENTVCNLYVDDNYQFHCYFESKFKMFQPTIPWKTC